MMFRVSETPSEAILPAITRLVYRSSCMRQWTFIAMASALFLFSLSLSAQTVDEIIAKHIAAQGGMTKLKAVQSIRMTGNFERGGMQAGFTQVFKRPMKMRL